MQRITREQARKYAFNWQDEPLLRVQPGAAFSISNAAPGFLQALVD